MDRLQPFHLLLCLGLLGCDRSEETAALVEKIDTLEQTVRDLDKAAAAEREALAADVKARCRVVEVPVEPGAKAAPTAKRRELDPDLQRRMDKVGVEMLEELSRNEEMRDVMKSAGKLTAKALDEMAKDLSED